MIASYDSEKNAENIRRHGVAFEEVDELDWEFAVTRRDARKDYGEVRFVTYAWLYGRLHCLVWTWRFGDIRPISFRKANSKERKRYEKEKGFG